MYIRVEVICYASNSGSQPPLQETFTLDLPGLLAHTGRLLPTVNTVTAGMLAELVEHPLLDWGAESVSVSTEVSVRCKPFERDGEIHREMGLTLPVSALRGAMAFITETTASMCKLAIEQGQQAFVQDKP